MAALVGGGTRPRPGEAALAHLGLLFLDELPEFHPQMLDALRQPLETGETVIGRANHRIAYPSRIQLIAAMNPCRCGRAGEPGYVCRQGRACAERYQARISGPMLDRIDLQIEVSAVSAADLVLPQASEGSADVRARVTQARRIQTERYAALGQSRMRTNAECDGAMLEEIVAPEPQGLTLLRDAADALSLSARGYHRTLRVARTLADLDGETKVRIHIAEALSYRGETLRRAQAAA
jgi:magnesium chelatase family protein